MRTAQHQLLTALAILVLVISMTACPASTPSTREIKSKLDSAANYLNAGAKVNRELYETKVTTLEVRRKTAAQINTVNGYLKMAVERSKSLKSCAPDDAECGIDFDITKVDILAQLNKGLTALQNFRSGNQKIDAVLTLAIPLIQQAITLAEAVKAIKETA